MTTASQRTKRKLSLLQLAEELGNVSKACEIMGYHRDTFYEVQKTLKPNGLARSQWPADRMTTFEEPAVSFRHAHTRATHLLREVLDLRQPVLDSQLRFLVVDVDSGAVREVRDDGCIHIRESHAGMLGKDVTAARSAPFAITVRCLVVSADVVRSPRDLHRLRLP